VLNFCDRVECGKLNALNRNWYRSLVLHSNILYYNNDLLLTCCVLSNKRRGQDICPFDVDLIWREGLCHGMSSANNFSFPVLVQECTWGSGTHYHNCIAYPYKIHIKYTNKQSLGRIGVGVGMAFPLKKHWSFPQLTRLVSLATFLHLFWTLEVGGFLGLKYKSIKIHKKCPK